jgi:MFS family permease
MGNRASLDWLSFLLADVKDGLGPFLAVYLLSERHWSATEIGVVMTIGGVATVVARMPAGALVDATRAKRGLIVVAGLLVAAMTTVIGFAPDFSTVAMTQAATGACDAVFPPALAAISLGLVGRPRFTRRIGRNEAFNHGGNAVTAVLAGLASWLIAPSAVLWLVAILAVLSCAAALLIDPRRIDHELARGSDPSLEHPAADAAPSGLGAILGCRPLLVFAAAITLFHFANAPMLPLLGERLARSHEATGTLFMAACIITAQVAMVPMALLVGRKADAWGRKPIFLIGFAVLPLRGVLYTLVGDNSAALVAIQVLDGVGAGIFGALFFLVVADLTRGTGHYNLAQGTASAAWGLGAALSNSVAGWIVDRAGFDAGFLSLSAIAALAFLLVWLAVPETYGPDRRALDRGSALAQPEAMGGE